MLAQADRVAPTSAPGPAIGQRHRPLWLVAVLSLVTIGLYTPVWMALTWSEMKAELHDDNMYPAWHGLTFFVPIYAYFRIHAHYRIINELLSRVGATTGVNPGSAVLGFIIGNMVGGLSNAVPGGRSVFFLLLISSAIVAAVLVYGQAGLNAYWRAVSNEVVPK